MNVIPDEPIGDRCLRRGGLERRMRINHPHRGVEARIRNAEHSHLTVVARHILHQPVDRVVSVRAFVRVLRSLVRIEGPHVHVVALRAVAPAHILRHEDEPVLRQHAERPDGVRVIVRAVRLQRVGRAREHDGPRLRIVLGHIHAREKMHAVAHRNAVLVLGIMLRQPERIRIRSRLRDARERSNEPDQGVE